MKKTYEQLAEDWLKEHYPEKKLNEYGVDVRYSAVYNFAIWLDKREKRN